MRTARQTFAPPLAERPAPSPELDALVPAGLPLSNRRRDLPRIARDPKLTDEIVAAVHRVPNGGAHAQRFAEHERQLKLSRYCAASTPPQHAA